VFGHAQHAKDDLAAVFPDEDHFDAAFADDIEGVAWVILEQDDAPFGVLFIPRDLSEPLKLIGWDLAEEGDGGEEIGNFHRAYYIKRLRSTRPEDI
jgi:hypothetical protein